MADDIAPSLRHNKPSILEKTDNLLHAPLRQHDSVMMDTVFAGLQDAHMNDADQSNDVAADTATAATDLSKSINDVVATEISSTPATAPSSSNVSAMMELFADAKECEFDDDKGDNSRSDGDVEGSDDSHSRTNKKDLEFEKLRHMSKANLESKLLSLAIKIEECQIAKQKTGKYMLRQLYKKVKLMPEGKAKTLARANVKMIHSTFNEYVNAFKGATEDNSIFLELSQVFKAEYDSRVTFPNEIMLLQEKISRIERILEEKMKERMQKEIARSHERIKHMLECMQYAGKKRKNTQRDLAAEDAMISSWQMSSMKPHKRRRKHT